MTDYQLQYIYVQVTCENGTYIQLCQENMHMDDIPLGREDGASFDTYGYDGNIYIDYEEYDEKKR